MVRITQFTASSTVGNRQVAAVIASGVPWQAQGQFGNDAQRPFGPDQQMCQIISGCGFARLAAGAHDRAVGHDRLKRQNILAHCAIADRGGARSTGGGHSANAGIGAGIDREKQPRGAQILVQTLARDARLHNGVKVFGIDGKNAVHVAHVQTDTAADGQVLPFERTGSAIGCDRAQLFVADAQDRRHILGAIRVGNRVGRRHRKIRLVLPVQVAIGL